VINSFTSGASSTGQKDSERFPHQNHVLGRINKISAFTHFYNRDPELEYLKGKVTEEENFKEENMDKIYK